MASICSEQPPLDLPDSPKSSDSFSSLFDFDDDTVVSNVEIANPFDQTILSKKFLTCHGCSVPKHSFEVKKNVTVVMCSRYGCSSSSPKLSNGNITDTKLLLKKVKDSNNFKDAISVIKRQIVPKNIEKGETYSLSGNTEGVVRTRNTVKEPIVMQEMLLFLRGCYNKDEGIYELDEHGEVRDISREYGLSEREYGDRNPASNFDHCSYLDYVVRSDVDRRTAAEVTHKDLMMNAIKHNMKVRDNILQHIEKLRGYSQICLLHQVPMIESKIQEYSKKLETVQINIETIQKMHDSIVVDGKYYIKKDDETPHAIVPLSYILNHPSTRDGTLFIVKVCRNICREHRPDEVRYTSQRKSSDDDKSPKSRQRVKKWVFSRDRSPRSPSPEGRSRSRSGGKIFINKPNKCRNKSKKRHICKRKNVNRHMNRKKYRHMLTRRKRKNVTKRKLKRR
jgi:hypothetical protein